MIKKYLPADYQVTIKSLPKRLEATAPAGGRRSATGEKNQPMTAKDVLRGKKLDEEDKEVEKSEEQAKIGSKNPAASQNSADVPIHAKKWIDYTSKYGLGYILSNGCVGVFFNDATKIILDRDGK
mmetsp:Transcript_37082/g.42601  ORF Transcript_37082/g.42601 Transcript_37082/m.42601 type:complete len:125 (-) Transcript_37082:47-421(-)